MDVGCFLTVILRRSNCLPVRLKLYTCPLEKCLPTVCVSVTPALIVKYARYCELHIKSYTLMVRSKSTYINTALVPSTLFSSFSYEVKCAAWLLDYSARQVQWSSMKSTIKLQCEVNKILTPVFSLTKSSSSCNFK